MSSGNRGPGSPSRRPGAFRPFGETLEGRQLLSTLNLATTQSTPLGVQMVGQNNTGATTQVTGAGYTVTDVGDLTGNGYDDYVVAAPGLTAPTFSGTPTFTGTSTVYLIFGSSAVNMSTIVNYATIPNNQRAGDLGQLGGVGTTPPGYQINPTLTQPATPTLPFTGYNFNGLTLTTGATPASGLGFSVAALGDLNGSGFNDFAIGAPNDGTGGHVYVIYGGASLAALANGSTQTTKILDLEPTTGTSGLVNAGVKVVNIMDSAATTGSRFGYSVAGIGNYINYGPGIKDVGIGAPGLNSNAGAAFALSGLYLNTLPSGTIDIANDFATTPTNNYGIEYQGAAGDQAGFSVSSGGNFDGYTTTGTGYAVDDFLIGAPQGANSTTTIPGHAYLVYGHQFVALTNGISDMTLGSIQQLSQIGTVPTATPLYTPLEGLTFNPPPGSFGMGWSVSYAGDYNGDGLGDVVIGSPFGSTAAATVFYGQPRFTPTVTNPATPPHIVGTYALGSQTYSGTQVGDLAGFSVAYLGDLTGEGLSGILIGAPGTNSGLGEAYSIPGNYVTPTTAYNTVPLATAITSATYAGTGFTTSNSLVTGTASNLPFLGTSVSGRSPFVNTATNSIDTDNIPDIFIGAPGFNLADPAATTTVSRVAAGESFALEGTFLPRTPPNDVIITAAGIGANNTTGPYSIAAGSTSLTVYLFPAAAANGNPAFNPATDVTSPATLVINGVTFTNVTLTAVGTTGEVSFVINPATLNLVAGTTIAFTIRGTTTAGTVFIGRAATVAVTSGGGTGGGGGGGGVSGPSAATVLASPIFTGQFGGLPYPPVSTLSTLISYQAIPETIAYAQYQVAPGFLAREQTYINPKKGKTHQAPVGTIEQVSAIRGSINLYAKKNTLSHSVFTKSAFKQGKTVTFTHKVKVIPAVEQTQKFTY